MTVKCPETGFIMQKDDEQSEQDTSTFLYYTYISEIASIQYFVSSSVEWDKNEQ